MRKTYTLDMGEHDEILILTPDQVRLLHVVLDNIEVRGDRRMIAGLRRKINQLFLAVTEGGTQ